MCLKIEVKVIPRYSAPLKNINDIISNLSYKIDVPFNSIKITSIKKSHQTYYLEFNESEKNAPLKEIINYFNKLEGYCAKEKF